MSELKDTSGVALLYKCFYLLFNSFCMSCINNDNNNNNKHYLYSTFLKRDVHIKQNTVQRQIIKQLHLKKQSTE